jgi:hypothetical protein
MACWNAAGSYADGMITPYRAASMIEYVGYHEPPEEPELLAEMRHLRERYEDEPEHRPAVAAEIGAELARWLRTRPG